LAGGPPEISERVGPEPDRCETREKTETSRQGTPFGNPIGMASVAACGRRNTGPSFGRQGLQAV
jgi:hypothetical protein